MFFVTNEPRIFNEEASITIGLFGVNDSCRVDIDPGDLSIFYGTREQCKSFILALARDNMLTTRAPNNAGGE